MHNADDSQIAAALIYQLRPRPASVQVAPNGLVSWDAGEEIAMPSAKRKNGAWWASGPWLRPRAANSLTDVMAIANCRAANACGRAELATVCLCIAKAPFPLGRGADFYLAALQDVEAAYLRLAMADLTGEHTALTTLEHWLVELSTMSVGSLRANLVIRASSGCNAPTDSYLRIAAWFAANPFAAASDLPPGEGY